MFLTSQAFAVVDGELVKYGDSGFSLVFFYTPTCTYCNDVKPAFEYLAQIVKNCNFFYCNVDSELHKKSLNTKTPITYVPLIYLLAKGRIWKQFFPDEDNPDNNKQLLLDFLNQATSQYNHSITNTAPSQNKPESTSFGIPYNTLTSRQKKICRFKF